MTPLNKENAIVSLYKSNKTVFSIKDLALIWQIDNSNYLKTKINRYLKSEKLYFIRKGFYALDGKYDVVELANKMIVPSYFGLYSVLAREGVNFQYDSRVFSVSRESRTIVVGETEYVYLKIKDSVLLNPLGLRFLGDKTISTKERAIVDLIYLWSGFAFDNLSNVDWDKCLAIANIYQSSKVLEKVKKLKEAYA
ncbi:hypothetical protein COT78_00765 [Candidatus Berkelbacteria bacterium CG10_big_fil_rev_8_21_14_0_10_43_13]|uniref:AbiEi antitoxin C-terminal domain-containing protein n=1 Tax=Candidatus Berkelbacteria bacterium CG10_big_fil_rev_8_21_14_0_10_43_13 TaxID=1974514 RepID=A0A2H0W9G0_9BACT|nr:MAG: hypothetical protein COT78_00765 [Candidatus Berkelbacteria bacterium CG10_big_fil_rev_8_21_14_0_10_43_13]